MNDFFISVIIPCRNEERFIAKCLDCILGQNYPQGKMEILIADGGSTDDTRKILEVYAQKFPQVRWFDNPGKIVPTGLNILIRQTKGKIIVRMDAHNEYPEDYISKCVKALIEHKADNVGGLWITRPSANTLTAKAIALAVSTGFGVGNVSYKLGVKVATAVDTVPFGCFRRDIFDKVGLFDEDMVRAQDSELNHRIIKSGGKIMLIPDIFSYYHARDSFSKLLRMYSQYGYFKVFTAVKLGSVFTVRQLIPAIFVSSVLLLAVLGIVQPVFWWLFVADLGVYAAANILFSAKLAMKEDVRLFPFLVWAFCLIHACFGFNYLRGVVDFWFLKKHLHMKISDLPLTR